MASGIRWFSCSGALGGTPSTRAVPNIEIFNFEPRATNSPNRIGFFGQNGAPSSPVIVGLYQDRTHRTNHHGSDLGPLINVKYTGASDATVSGVPLSATGITLAQIPQASGTVLLRFAEPNNTNVITQNGTFRAVNMTAASGVPEVSSFVSNITIQAAQLADTAGTAGDASWTDITAGYLSLADQALEASVHDYHIILSASPLSAGRKINFGFYCYIEFL